MTGNSGRKHRTARSNATNCSRRPTCVLRRRENWSINDGSAAGSCADPAHSASPACAAVLCSKSIRTLSCSTMFGFLTSGTKEAADPLVSPKSVAAWLRQLPALDVIGRQQQVMRAFDAMRASRKPIDIARVQAIEYLDAALGADRRQLTKQYVENYDSAPKLAERIWQSIYDLVAGLHLRVPDRARGGAAAGRQRALEAADAAAVRAAHRITTAPTPSSACSASNAGFPASGWSCTAPTCARRSSASIACRPCWQAAGRTPRRGRSSRNTSTSC